MPNRENVLTHLFAELLLRQPGGPHLLEQPVCLTHHGAVDLPAGLVEEALVLVPLVVVVAVLLVRLLR